MYLQYVSYSIVESIVILYSIVLHNDEDIHIFQTQIRGKTYSSSTTFQYGFGHSCRLKISKKFHNNSWKDIFFFFSSFSSCMGDTALPAIQTNVLFLEHVKFDKLSRKFLRVMTSKNMTIFFQRTYIVRQW